MYYFNEITREILQKRAESGDGTWGRAEFAGARRSVCKIPTSV